MCWLAGDDPGKMANFEKLPVLEYFMILDKKLADTKTAIRTQEQANIRRR
ncbi:MAG: hypothetical protein H0X33_14180 [Taibaiella sp.]|nr:hypothetical protein [Taibaiella sp.]